jgi:hypothetical protein
MEQSEDEKLKVEKGSDDGRKFTGRRTAHKGENDKVCCSVEGWRGGVGAGGGGGARGMLGFIVFSSFSEIKRLCVHVELRREYNFGRVTKYLNLRRMRGSLRTALEYSWRSTPQKAPFATALILFICGTVRYWTGTAIWYLAPALPWYRTVSKQKPWIGLFI